VSVVRVSVLTLFAAAVACGLVFADSPRIGNLGYNSFEGYLSKGAGLHNYFGPGVGYQTNNGDYFRRYIPAHQWGQYGNGTGHLGDGYGPYVFGRRDGPSPPGMFDPLPGAYRDAPPPKIKVGHGQIRVSLPSDIPGITCVTVTLVAFNNADLDVKSIKCPPFAFVFPVPDGVKSVRVRIDYVNNGLSATSYPL